MKFKAGDKVKVKSYSEIKKTLDDGGRAGIIYFADGMRSYCGVICVVDYERRIGYVLEKCDYWNWIDEWLEPVYKKLDEDLFKI